MIRHVCFPGPSQPGVPGPPLSSAMPTTGNQPMMYAQPPSSTQEMEGRTGSITGPRKYPQMVCINNYTSAVIFVLLV